MQSYQSSVLTQTAHTLWSYYASGTGQQTLVLLYDMDSPLLSILFWTKSNLNSSFSQVKYTKGGLQVAISSLSTQVPSQPNLCASKKLPQGSSSTPPEEKGVFCQVLLTWLLYSHGKMLMGPQGLGHQLPSTYDGDSPGTKRVSARRRFHLCSPSRGSLLRR